MIHPDIETLTDETASRLCAAQEHEKREVLREALLKARGLGHVAAGAEQTARSDQAVAESTEMEIESRRAAARAQHREAWAEYWAAMARQGEALRDRGDAMGRAMYAEAWLRKLGSRITLRPEPAEPR